MGIDSETALAKPVLSTQNFHKTIQGNWRQIAWYYESESRFIPESESVYIVKQYAQSTFSWARYLSDGTLVSAGGGRYQILSNEKLVEFQTYHFDRHPNSLALSTEGRATTVRHESMVGAEIHYTISFDDEKMRMRGIIKQNTQKLNPSLHKDISFDVMLERDDPVQVFE
jgi:hypothetical protein